jgi:hypothetical protein
MVLKAEESTFNVETVGKPMEQREGRSTYQAGTTGGTDEKGQQIKGLNQTVEENHGY